METLILCLGLFYPEVALLIGYFTNSLFNNPVPFLLEVILFLVHPRLLFIIYIVVCGATIPYAPMWLIAYIVASLITAPEWLENKKKFYIKSKKK